MYVLNYFKNLLKKNKNQLILKYYYNIMKECM